MERGNQTAITREHAAVLYDLDELAAKASVTGAEALVSTSSRVINVTNTTSFLEANQLDALLYRLLELVGPR